MPLKFKCNCGKSVQAPESMAGKKAKCPACGNIVLIPALQPLKSETPLEDLAQLDPFAAAAEGPSSVTLSRSSVPAPAAKRAASDPRQGLGIVHLGVTLMFISLFVAVIALGLVLFSPSFAPLLMAATVLGIVGKVLCLAVPQPSRARGILVVVLGLDALALLVNGVGLASALQPIWRLTASALPFVSFVLFMVFLERLAKYIRRNDLAESATDILKMGAGIVGATTVPPIVLILGTTVLPAPILALLALLMLLLPIAALICGVYLLFRYAGLLQGIRQAL